MADQPTLTVDSVAYDAEGQFWTVTIDGVTEEFDSPVRVTDGEDTYVLVGGGAYGTLTAALADAVDGDVIMVAPGTYTETLTVNKDVTITSLEGEKFDTVIEGGIHVTANGVTIEGLTVQGGSSFFGAGPAGILVQANGVTLQNNALYGAADSIETAGRGVLVAVATGEDLVLSGNTMIGWASGAYLNPGATGEITGNTFTENNVGLSMDDPSGLSVSGNTFDRNYIEQIGAAVPSTALDLSEIAADNTFANTPAGKQQVFIYGDGDNEAITGTAAADAIDGGDGIDTVTYAAGAKIAFVSGTWTVSLNGVIDTLTGVERVTIGGQTYLLVDEDGEAFDSIQGAIDLAGDGDTILIASGYYEETLTVTKAVTITSLEGNVDSTTIKGGIHVLEDGVTIDGLTIENGAAFPGETAAGVFVQAANVTITNSTLTGPNNAAGSRGIVTDASATGLDVSNNTVSGWASGAYLNPGAAGSVNGNIFTENNVGLSMDDPNGISVAGNTFDDNFKEQIGAAVPDNALDLSEIVADNTFENTPEGQQQVFIYGDGGDETITNTAAADKIMGGRGTDTVIYDEDAKIEFVDGAWTVTSNGVTDILTGVERVIISGKAYVLVDENDAEGFTTIQEAVTAAENGDTILVAAGNYSGSVLVDKNVTIKGAQAGIAGSAEGRGEDEAILDGGFHVMADGVTIDGFSIQNGSAFHGSGTAGIVVQANGVTLQNNVLKDTDTNLQDGTRGVLVAIGTGEDLILKDNQMEGWSTGAYLNPGAAGTVEGNTFKGNYVGLSMDAPKGITVTGNTFDGNALEQIGALVPGDSLDLSEIVAGNTFKGTPEGLQQVFIYGDGDDETIVGTAAADKIMGEGGFDTATYAAGAKIAFVAGDEKKNEKSYWTVTLNGVTDTLTGVESVIIGGQTYFLVDIGNGELDSIQDAVDLASDGDIVMVGAGRYSETVTVDKDVTIQGFNAGVAGHDRVSLGMGQETVITGGIHVLKDGVTLDGLGIAAGSIGGEIAGVFVQAANVTITNSVLTGDYGSSAPTRGIVTDASAKGLTISDNAMAGWATGAYLNPGTTGTVTGNVLIGNNVGISIDDPNGLSVTGNVLFGNTFENIGLGVYANAADAGAIIGANTILSAAAGGAVSIYGLGSGHTIQGTAYADTFYGSKNADVFVGGAGNDVINGGDGEDTAVFSGNRTDYAVSLGQNGKVTIADLRGNGGTDILSDVESFQFSNGKISLDTLVNNKAPTAVTLDANQVAENEGNGIVIGKLWTSDVNKDDTHTYELIDNAGGRFAISNGQLVVSNGSLLDYEQAQSHQVVVRATDMSGATYDQVLTVSVTDVRDENFGGSSGSDNVVGGSGKDRIFGGEGNDLLDGGAGKDVLNGGTGNDRLVGGAGQDTLTGGSGKDVFVFGHKDTSASKKSADYITDFSRKQGDKIDLSAIDANATKKGNQAFSFIGTGDFTKAGQVRYEKEGKYTYVYLNTDNDKAAEAVIKLKGAMDMQKSWFVL
ncbi:NosD domain-containing protein [Microvirga guangxiensis]|uniref:Type I secretion C-terminal target domain (VC_A0849 subclass) n=1 Tax=Microvirga guangxiensis TaxID=549386 RepID=A0A1G5K2Z8_9HYPH|nr:NosD domain-containing protein [Microvirga guangxiensis]SCY94936.1 type I secretion C-terminal target domain (VC_A0849 subclass) [Microvirga guangxiensis]